MKLGLLELRSKQWRRDAFTGVGIFAAQADAQSASHCAFRLTGVGTFMFFAITPPNVQG